MITENEELLSQDIQPYLHVYTVYHIQFEVLISCTSKGMTNVHTQSYENNLAEHPTNIKTKQSECSSPEAGS